jgi:hypothetical protein
MLEMRSLKFQKVPGFLVKMTLIFQESRRSREPKSPGVAEKKKYKKRGQKRPTSWAFLPFFERFLAFFDVFSVFRGFSIKNRSIWAQIGHFWAILGQNDLFLTKSIGIVLEIDV